MKTLAAISLFTTAALAQSYSSAPAATGSPLIPSDISSGCKTFLDTFNKDPSLTACTSSLIEATKSFGPGGSSSSPSKAEVVGAIDSICNGSANSACPDSLIRGQLASFYAACSDELTSKPNEKVRNTYEVLYAVTPMKKAICSKDDSANYCAVAGSDATSSGIKGALATETGFDLDSIQKALYNTPAPLTRRAEDAITANLTTFGNTNLPFLFRSPNMDSAALCTTCTRNILTAYFDYESDVLFAPGMSNSAVLKRQSELVGVIQEKCGANFLNGAVQAAGGIKQGPLGADSGAQGLSTKFSGVLAVVAGGLTVAISFLV